MSDAERLTRALAYIATLEAEAHNARMLGHRDGIVTAMLAVRRRMGPACPRVRPAGTAERGRTHRHPLRATTVVR